MELKIGASILAADFSCLDREMQRIEKAGIDFFHVDIMDGHFVPNITIGPAVVKNIRKVSQLPFDVHLMIAQPLKWVEQFIKAGSDMITLHIETISPKEFRSQAKGLKSKGIKLGVSLNPDTPIKKIEQLLELVDFVLVMTVIDLNLAFGRESITQHSVGITLYQVCLGIDRIPVFTRFKDITIALTIEASKPPEQSFCLLQLVSAHIDLGLEGIIRSVSDVSKTGKSL